MARLHGLIAAAIATAAAAMPDQGGLICSNWLCIMGINTPLRVNAAGNVECLSSNHHDCAWQSNHEGCVAVKNAQQATPLSPPISEKPLVCGADHLREWGSTGYDAPNHWCSQAYRTLGRPTAPTTWTCLPNINTPVRVNPANGEVECMSSNHHDCLWQSSADDCQLLVDTRAPSASIDPLVCGAGHLKEWGVTGYDTPNHWCAQVSRTLGRPAAWTCLPNVNTPVRVNPANGDVECMSSNHHDCLWQSSAANCQLLVNKPPTSIDPLVCGTNHLKEWGSTGYDAPNHWCSQSYRTLGRATTPTTWTCLPNIHTPVRVNPVNGEVECMSSNHHDCLWQSSAANCQLLVSTNAPPASIDSLVCGALHQKEWGMPGYGTANHWCELSRKALVPAYRPWECLAGIFTPVRRTLSGSIQCLSTNGKDCVWQTSDTACRAVVAGLGTTPALAWGCVNPLTCPASDLVAVNHWCQKAKTYYDSTKSTAMLWALAQASVESAEWSSIGLAAAGVVGCVVALLAVVVVRQRDAARAQASDATNDYYIALVHT